MSGDVNPLLEPGEQIDVTRPSAARLYDAYLGGKDNYEVDRAAFARLREVLPELPAMAQVNRAFLVRVVTWLAREAGIRQFVDIGSGLPTQQNVHQVAQAIDPACRVVYVDNDPSVLTHSRVLLTHTTNTAFIRQDLRQPDAILTDPKLRDLIDLDQPVALMLVAVLHFLTEEDDPYGVVRTLRDSAVPGSYLALSHVISADPVRAEQITAIYRASNAPSGAWRTRDEIHRFFGDFEPVEPGLVAPHEWRPELGTPPDAEIRAAGAWGLAGMARKR